MATIFELAEALTSSQTAALLQKQIDDNLLDVFRKENPLKEALPVKDWQQAVYYWNTRNRLPYAQAVTEAPPTNGTGAITPSQSTYLQNSVPVAHYQVNGDLSKFNIKVAHAAIENLLEEEMTASVQSMAWVQSMFHIYGSAVATSATFRPQWDGFDRQISNSQRLLPFAGAGNGLVLQDFDNLIDSVRTKIAAPLPGEDFFIICSEPAISKMGRLLLTNNRQETPVMLRARRSDGQTGQVLTAEAGIEVPSYRGIPIVGTSFLTPSGNMTTVTPSAAGTGSTITAAQRFYSIEAVGQYGPTYALAPVSITPTAGQNVTLTFTTPTMLDIFGNQQPILQYRVYEGSASGTVSLYGIVAATDAADNAVTSIVDNGSSLVANPGANQVIGLFTGVSAVAGDGASFPITAPAQGFTERIWLASRNPAYVCVPTVTEVESEILASVNSRTVQYSLVGDCALAMRAPAFAAVLQQVNTN